MISNHAGSGRVVLDELGHKVIQMSPAEDDELAEEFLPDRLSESLASAIQVEARHR